MSWIIFWLAIYFIVHSILADHRTKAWFAQVLGEYRYQGLYRLLYNAIALITLMPIVPAIFTLDTVILEITPPASFVLRMIQLIGLIGLVVSFLQIDWLQFAGFTQLFAYLRGKPLPLPQETLQTSGLYAWTRHPLYFFSLLTIWFNPALTQGMLLLNIMVTLYVVIGSRIEEKRMLRIYGENYQKYIREVPWLIPSARKLFKHARPS